MLTQTEQDCIKCSFVKNTLKEFQTLQFGIDCNKELFESLADLSYNFYLLITSECDLTQKTEDYIKKYYRANCLATSTFCNNC